MLVSSVALGRMCVLGGGGLFFFLALLQTEKKNTLVLGERFRQRECASVRLSVGELALASTLRIPLTIQKSV